MLSVTFKGKVTKKGVIQLFKLVKHTWGPSVRIFKTYFADGNWILQECRSDFQADIIIVYTKDPFWIRRQCFMKQLFFTSYEISGISIWLKINFMSWKLHFSNSKVQQIWFNGLKFHCHCQLHIFESSVNICQYMWLQKEHLGLMDRISY